MKLTKSLFSLGISMQTLERHHKGVKRKDPTCIYQQLQWDSRVFCESVKCECEQFNETYGILQPMYIKIMTTLETEWSNENLSNLHLEIQADLPNLLKDLRETAIAQIVEKTKELPELLSSAQAHSYSIAMRDLAGVLRFVAKIESRK